MYAYRDISLSKEDLGSKGGGGGGLNAPKIKLQDIKFNFPMKIIMFSCRICMHALEEDLKLLDY